MPDLRTRTLSSAASSPKKSAYQARSEEHTSELQSPCNLVCRLLLEKKKKTHQLALVYAASAFDGPLVYPRPPGPQGRLVILCRGSDAHDAALGDPSHRLAASPHAHR